MEFLRHTSETDLVVFKESMEELRVNQGEVDDYICRVGALLHLTSLFARHAQTAAFLCKQELEKISRLN